ncbi:MAG TPA: creatininase family protein [Chloroflexota bacterium]|nr:creatininase family protein [Chloroflexota bacterium]
MTVREVRWERMLPDELEAAFAACPLVYFAYGLCEPHGPQNALGLDTLKAHGIACRAAWAHGGVVAPPDFWHIHELGGYASWAARAVGEVERSWLTAVPPWVHFKNVLYQIRAADALGFHGALLITGHYGPNWRDLKRLVELVQPRVGVRLYALPDFEANQPGFAQDGQSGGDHAGRVETSLLWAIEPECVDVSRIPPPDAGAHGPHFAMGPNAGEANRRIGERMVEDEVQWLGQKARELLAAYDREAPTDRLRTFAETEVLWTEVVLPALPTFETMQDRWGDQPPPPEGSVWRTNWPVPKL